jgi:hypothetical protein
MREDSNELAAAAASSAMVSSLPVVVVWLKDWVRSVNTTLNRINESEH